MDIAISCLRLVQCLFLSSADIQDTNQQLLLKGAAKNGLLGEFKQFKELEGIQWDMCTDDNKTVIYYLLDGSETTKEKRREVLTWLMEKEQKDICDELSKVVNKKNTEGVTVLATVCKMPGEGDLVLSDHTSPTRDSVIEWLLGLGADITDVPFTHANDFFDRDFKGFLEKESFSKEKQKSYALSSLQVYRKRGKVWRQ